MAGVGQEPSPMVSKTKVSIGSGAEAQTPSRRGLVSALSRRSSGGGRMRKNAPKPNLRSARGEGQHRGGTRKFPVPLCLLLELLDDVVGVGDERAHQTETRLKPN
jgi:hypothetical protein